MVEKLGGLIAILREENNKEKGQDEFNYTLKNGKINLQLTLNLGGEGDCRRAEKSLEIYNKRQKESVKFNRAFDFFLDSHGDDVKTKPVFYIEGIPRKEKPFRKAIQSLQEARKNLYAELCGVWRG